MKWFRNFQNRFCVQRSRHSPCYHHPVLPGETFPGVSLEDFWPITDPGTVLVIITQFYQVRLFQASHWRISDQLQAQAQSSLSSPSSTRWDFSRHFIGGFLTNHKSRHSPRYHHPVLSGETFPGISLEDFWPITGLDTTLVIITQFYQVRLFQASHWRISDQLHI